MDHPKHCWPEKIVVASFSIQSNSNGKKQPICGFQGIPELVYSSFLLKCDGAIPRFGELNTGKI